MPKGKASGTGIPRTSGRHSGAAWGQKSRAGPRSLGKTGILGADIHGPKVRTSMTPAGCTKDQGRREHGNEISMVMFGAKFG